MPLLPLAAVAIALIAVGVLLVCAAHVPGLRVLVGAQPVGPVPAEDDAQADEEMRAMLTALADAVIREHHTQTDARGRAA